MTQKVYVMATLDEDNYAGVDYFLKKESVDCRTNEDHPNYKDEFNYVYYNGVDHILEFDDSVDLIAAGFEFSD
jgi:hypothetical protein